MRLTIADVRASFDWTTFARGETYARAGRVVRLELDDADDRIEATVRGTSTVPYEVEVVVGERPGGKRSLHTWCDCPVGERCKHAAAAAILAAEKIAREALKIEERPRDAADGAVDSWLQTMTAHRVDAVDPHREHVRYVLDVREAYYVPRLEFTARAVSPRAQGEVTPGRSVDFAQLAQGSARYASPVDRTIGRLASATGLAGFGSLSPKLFASLLDLAISTGRLHWNSPLNAPLHRADIAEARFAWQVDAQDARQRPGIEGRPSARLLPAIPLWYVDPQRGEAGTVELPIAADLASSLALAPSMSAAQARRAHLVWHRIPYAEDVPPPQTGLQMRVLERDPVPRLALRAFVAPRSAVATLEPLAAVAELTFAYGDAVVRPGDNTREFSQPDAEGVTVWPRRLSFEAGAVSALNEWGFTPVYWPHAQFLERSSTTVRFTGPSAERSWARFLDDGVAALRASGWEIEIEPRFPYQVVHIDDAEDAAAWDAEVVDGEGNKWFELDLGIDVGGKRVSLLPVVVDALQAMGVRSADELVAELTRGKARALYGRLPDGTFVALPPERVTRIVSTLVELFDAPLTKAGRLELTPAHVASIEQLDGSVGVRWRSTLAAPLRALLSELASGNPEPVELPATFAGVLRGYQATAVGWLQTLRRHGFGGVLADDMGLGKTVQFLAHLAVEKAAGRLRAPVLIVAPTSVLPNWRAEIARFVPHLEVVTLTGADRAERYERVAGSDVALTSYALLHRDAERLTGIEWSMAVLDEAQFVKNPRSKGAQAAARLRASQHLALTGTPIENHLEELWSIFSFAIPGLLGDRAAFRTAFRTPIEKRGDNERRALLGSRLKPFLMRRTKEDVALDLPEKTEIITRIELDGAQRDLYETIRLAMHERVREEMKRRGLARSRIVVLDALMKLRQACCDPRLVKLPAARNVHESSKMEALFEMLPELIDEGRRVLLFSQFTSMLDLIEPECDRLRIPYVKLRGETKDRETPVRQFQNGEVPLFLISLKAGGTGLNLTAADTVIHYDPWWNPAVERQATDRAHRIGQLKPVFVYKLITVGTVEERILDLQARKGELAASLFNEAASSRALEADEIERLFAPP